MEGNYSRHSGLLLVSCLLAVAGGVSDCVGITCSRRSAPVDRMMAVAEKNQKKRERELREREMSTTNAARPIRANGGKVTPNNSTAVDTRSNGTSAPVSGHTGTDATALLVRLTQSHQLVVKVTH